MNLDKQKAFIIHVIYYAFLCLLLYIVIKFVLPLLMPFVIGIIIALIFRNPIDFLTKKTHVKRSFVSIFILIIFYSLIALIVSLIGLKVFNFLKDFILSLPDMFNNSIKPALLKIMDDLGQRFPSIKDYLDNFINNLGDTINSISAPLPGKIAGFAGHLPSLLINLIFTIVASFFFTIDYYKITRFIVRQFTGERREMVLKLKDNGIGTLGKFIRAYAAIISITFIELSVGFWILRIPNPFLFGALVAIIDILPILGTGAVLIPWSIISFIMGNTSLGIGILLLYIFVTVVRQTIEPKIVGQQIGLHPLLTLLLMYVGTKLMGVLGLLLLPILATIIKKLDDEGTIHIIKK